MKEINLPMRFDVAHQNIDGRHIPQIVSEQDGAEVGLGRSDRRIDRAGKLPSFVG